MGLAALVDRAVAGAVAKTDEPLALEARERGLVGLVAALTVGDGQLHTAPVEGVNGPSAVVLTNQSPHSKRRETLRVRAPGSKPRLGEDLEAVADAEHVAAARGVGADGGDDGTDLRDGAAAQVVAEGEAAGKRDEIGARGQGGVRCQAVVVGTPQTSRRVWIISASALEPGKTIMQARIAVKAG